MNRNSYVEYNDPVQQSLRILVIEDQEDSGRAVQRFLEFRGHKVKLATTSACAMEMASDIIPEVLLCDWKLADNDDSVEATRHLQAKFDIPVVLMTGHRLTQARKEMRESEVNIAAFRRKPVSLPDLANLIETLATSEISA